VTDELGFGYLEDEPDVRDFPLSSLHLATPPVRVSLREHVTILNQGALGSCVANAIAQAVRVVQRRNGENDVEFLSRLFAYWHARNQHGATKVDSGTYIRLAIKCVNRLGRPPESVWPYVTHDRNEPDDEDGTPRATYKRKPPPNVMIAANDKRKASYYRIAATGDARVDEIKRALAAGKPVVFGTQLGESFRRYDGSGVLEAPTNETIIGGHAMVLDGYEGDEHATGANSHGTGWGDRGFFKISWSYLQWYRTSDLWAVDL